MIGFALARRLGVTSKHSVAMSIVLANLPDIDIPAGLILHHDMWKLHGRATHTPQFALTAGAVAGLLGLVSVSAADDERCVLTDALVGAALAGSHIVADRIPYVRLPRREPLPPVLRRRFFGMSVANWFLDAIQCFAIAAAITRVRLHRPASPRDAIRRA